MYRLTGRARSWGGGGFQSLPSPIHHHPSCAGYVAENSGKWRIMANIYFYRGAGPVGAVDGSRPFSGWLSVCSVCSVVVSLLRQGFAGRARGSWRMRSDVVGCGRKVGRRDHFGLFRAILGHSGEYRGMGARSLREGGGGGKPGESGGKWGKTGISRVGMFTRRGRRWVTARGISPALGWCARAVHRLVRPLRGISGHFGEFRGISRVRPVGHFHSPRGWRRLCRARGRRGWGVVNRRRFYIVGCINELGTSCDRRGDCCGCCC
jgi:hypothetical protein